MAAGTSVDLLCLTRGEGSTLGASSDLATRRAGELAAAGEVLGIGRIALRDHPDTHLRTVALPRLVTEVIAVAADADALLTFDDGGITGHPDHQHATDAAIAAGRQLGIPAYAWAIPRSVAAALREEFDAPFVGRDDTDLDVELAVDRQPQIAAMACHGSQLTDNPVPARRIELQGDREYLRLLT